MAFLSLLATAVGILSAMGLVVVGLVEAPWPVLLTGLLAALYGLQRVVNGGSEAQMLRMPLRSPTPSQAVEQVKQTAPEAAEGQASAAPPTAATTPPAEAATTADTYELTYRGIRYRVKKTSPASAAEPGDVEQPTPPKPTEGIYRGQRWQR